MSLDTSNKYFTLASDLVNYTSKNIFLTGKAGTGKTTFLKHIRQTCAKQMAVIAPTGVAAINAGGTTIHSFFQLPFSPFVPGNLSVNDQSEINTTHSLISRLKINNEKRKMFQALELLIIDEISMVRCDMVDAIDTVLKHFRNDSRPFGGVQLLFIGDMHQLPPVIPDSEWSILSQFYNSPFFFSSKVITEHEPLFISFEKIYRQSDEIFIQLLNAVRNNDLDAEHIKCLDSLYDPSFNQQKDRQSIILTTHNAKADTINAEELQRLSTPAFSFKAKIEGEFYEKYFPAEELLVIKPGAQVMFIKNDTEKIRRYFNGKIGCVESIDDDRIVIKCKDDDHTIEVSKERWENIRYNFNHSSKQIEEDIIGSFTQYPLRLAWAITIHKSQGLTFEKAVIDAGAAFSPGQVYVALSRCTQLDGLVLKSRINYHSLKTDQRIIEFSRNIASIPQIQSQLIEAKINYQKHLLLQLFDFSSAYGNSIDLQKFIIAETVSFNTDLESWVSKIVEQIKTLQDISHRFTNQLNNLFSTDLIPQESEPLQQRIMAAGKYFSVQLQDLISNIHKSPAITDSKQNAKTYNEMLFELFSLLTEKKFLFEICCTGFDGYNWHQKKKEFKLPSFKINAYSASSVNSNFVNETLDHPQLYHKLKQLRDEICNKNGKPVYLVANSQTLTEMCNYLPQNLHELSKISGFGKVRLKEVGEKFLSIIIDYCEAQHLTSQIGNKKDKKQKKENKENSFEMTDTKKETFRMYKEGKTISEIALARKLSATTINSHLAYYIESGAINIQDLLSKEKFDAIEPVIKNYEGVAINPLKEKLGNEISFSDIRLAMAWKNFNARSKNEN